MPKKKKPEVKPEVTAEAKPLDIRDRILAEQEEWKRQQHELHLARLAKIEHKRHDQRRNGWPSDKSPV